MILNIPHSGTNTLGVNISEKDIRRGTDWFVDDLFSANSANSVVQEHSRFIVDCDRLPDDIEPLYKEGYGICYSKDFDGNELNIALPNKEKMLKIYDDHHKELRSKTRFMLGCLLSFTFLIDCHSFGDEQVVSDVDFCLGFNDDFVYFEMLEKMKNHLEKNGYNVGLNNPFNNGVVPSHYYGDDLFRPITISVNKRLYLTDAIEKSDGFEKTKKIISELLEIISIEESRYD